jgi:hypothetical protein
MMLCQPAALQDTVEAHFKPVFSSSSEHRFRSSSARWDLTEDDAYIRVTESHTLAGRTLHRASYNAVRGSFRPLVSMSGSRPGPFWEAFRRPL